MKRLTSNRILTIVLFFGLAQLVFSQTTCFQSDNNYVFEGTFLAKSIAKGDFKNNGRLDIVMGNSTGASANPTDTRMDYIANNGSRDFAAPVSFMSGSRVYDVAAGDINGDGNLDVVVANFNMDRIGVLYGNGDGTFQTPIPYPLGINALPNSIVIADFDGDGLADVGVIGNTSNLYILLNSTGAPGTLTLQPTIALGVGANPSDIVAADFNGDNDVDLAIANAGFNTVTVYHGNGTGAFSLASSTTLAAASNPVGLVADKFNNDIYPDLAVLTQDAETVSIILNVGGAIPTIPTSTHNVGIKPTSIESADFYNNGNRDLVVVNADGNSLSILKGNGGGSFVVNTPTIPASNSPYSVVTGDFDLDGKDDVIHSTQVGGVMPVYWGLGDGTFLLGNMVHTGSSPRDMAAGDVDGDSKMDYVVVNYDDNTAGIYKGDGIGNFSFLSNVSTGTNPTSAVLGDFFGNGRQDLIVTNYTAGTISMYENTGSGLPASPTSSMSAGTHPIKIRKGDYNGDGNLDLFIVNENDNVTILAGDGAGNFGSVINIATGPQPKDIAVGDITNNGFDDFVVAIFGTNKADVYKSTGSGFPAAASHSLVTDAGPTGVALGDLNGDGFPEVIVACKTGNRIKVFANGAGVFSPNPAFGKSFTSPETGALSVVTGDFNDDGHIDVAVTNESSIASTGNVTIFLNIGTVTGPFNPTTLQSVLTYSIDDRYSVGMNPVAIIAADFDNNSCMDLAVVNEISNYVSVMINSGCGSPTITANGPLAICPGDNVILTSSPAGSYLWSNGETTQSITVTIPGSYSVTTTTGGCSGISNILVVTAASGPSCGPHADFIPDNTTVCVGEPVIFTDNSTGTITTWAWNFAGGTPGSASGQGPHTATFSSPGTYSVNLEVGDGTTTDDKTINIIVNALPTITVSGNVTVCQGVPTALTAGGGTGYIWSPATGLSATIGTTVSATPTSTTTYTVTGKDGNGCENTAQVTVTVNAAPTMTASPDAAICLGGSTTISASGSPGLTYTWSPTTGLSPTTGSPVTASPASTQTYIVTGTDGNNCTVTDNVTITVKPLPTINASGGATICSGQSTPLTASGGVSYLWSPATGLSGTTGPSVTANPTSTQTYTVTGTGGNGCENTATVTVTVNPLPTVTAGNDSPFCDGDVINLTSSGGATYSWTGPNSFTSPSQNPTISGTTINNAGTYTVTVTDGNGCVNTGQTVVVYQCNAAADFIPSSTDICIGEDITFTDISGGTIVSWTWDFDGGTPGSAYTQGPHTITFNTVGIHHITLLVEDNLANNSSKTIDVTVHALPTISAGSDVTICAGESTPLTATGGVSYVWSPATGLSGTTGANVTASPTSTITYEVLGTDVNGCENTNQVTVAVNSAPVVIVSPDATICSGEATTLTASGALTYSWAPPIGLSATTGPSVDASPTSNQTYTVTGTDGNGCKNTDQVVVTVNPKPTINAGSDVDICVGSSTTLTATGGISYIWSPATGLSSTTGTSVTANPTSTQTYLVKGTDGNGCENADFVTVTVNPIPTITVSPAITICIGGSTTLTAGGGQTYVWSPATGLSATIGTSVTATPTSTQTYTVTGTDVEGCENTATVKVTVAPLPTVTASQDVEICIGGSTQISVSGTSGLTYLWTPSTDLSSTTSASVTATPSTTRTYTVTGTDGNGCVNTDQVIVTVNPNPLASISGTTEICQNGTSPTITFTGSGGTSPYIFIYEINNGPVQTVTSVGNIATVTVPTGTAGVFIYELILVEDGSSTTCTSAASGTATVTINPTPSASIATSATAVCQGDVAPTITFTGSGGTSPYIFTYKINSGLNQTVTSVGNIATVTVPTGVTGPFIYELVSVEDGSTTACSSSATGSVTVTVNPNPTVTMSSSTTIVCQDGTQPTITFVGSGGTKPYTFTYNIGGPDQTITTIGSSSVAVVNVPTTTAGTFVYTLTSVEDNSSTSCATSVSEVVTITVNPLPTAVISGNATVCQNAAQPTITFTGSNGSSPYTFNYTIYNGTNTTSHTITTISGSSVTVNAPTNNAGTFTYTLVSVEDGGALTCSNTASGSVTITVNPLPTISAGTDVTICSGESTTLTATGGTSYVWTPATGLSSTIDPIVTANPTSTQTYTVTGTDGNSCVNTDQVIVTVNPNPIASISGTIEICQNDAAPTITFTGSGGTSPYVFTYTINSGTNLTVTSVGNIATVTVPTGTVGTFIYELVSVADGSSSTCSSVASGTATVTINPLPSANISVNITEVCQGDAQPTITFTGSGATAPYTFTYTINGGSGQTITSTGNTVTLNVPTGAAGTFIYQLISVKDASSTTCSASASGAVTIKVNQKPTVTMTASAIVVCQDEPGPTITFVGSGGTKPYTFTYNIGGGPDQTVVTTGSSSVAVVNVPTTTAGTYTYELTSIEDNSATNCSSSVSELVTITVDPLPNAAISGNASVCQNAAQPGITFTGSNGSSPYTFNYTIFNGTNTTSHTTTTVSGSSVTINASTNNVGTFTYTLVSVEDGGSLSCSNTASGSVTITVNPLPIANISGTIDVCEGAPNPDITFTGSNGTAPYIFTYTINGGSNNTVTSTGNTATLSVPTGTPGTFIYNLISVKDGSGTACSNTATGSATVKVNPRPTAGMSGTIVVCQNGTEPVITFTGSNGSPNYTFTYNIGGGPNQTVTSSGSTATVNVPTTTPGVFTYNLVSVSDGSSTACSNTATGSATVTVNPLPLATIGGTITVCKDDTNPNITFTGSGGTAPYTFTYTINGGGAQTITSGGSTVDISVSTSIPGTFTYQLISVKDASSTSCSNSASGTAVVKVNPLPTASISGTIEVCQNSVNPDVTFTGGNGTAPYIFTYTINGGLPQTVTSTGNTATVSAPTGTAGTYTYTLVSVEDASATTCSNSASGSAIVKVNSLPAALANITVGATEVCLGGTSPVITFTGSNGTPNYTFTYTINGGLPQTVTSIGNNATVTVPTGTAGAFEYELISVADGSASTCANLATGSVIITVNPLPDATFTGLATDYCIDDSISTLIPAQNGGNFTGTGVTGAVFNPSAAGTGSFTITYKVTDGNSCYAESSQNVTVHSLPNANYSGLGTGHCLDAAPVTLTPTQGGGTFSGNGITGSVFNPSNAGVGTHNITYSITDGNGCYAELDKAVVVFPLPDATFNTLANSYCLGAPAVNLVANQTGGSFTINGIGGSVFDPSALGAGTYIIKYSITNANGCSATESQTVTVNPLPNATFSGLLAGYCVSSSFVQLTPTQSGGTFNGPGIVSGNNFNPGVAGVGIHTIVYSITDGNGCSSTSNQQVEIYALPIATFTGLATTYCLNNTPVTLTPDQTGGSFSGPGIVSNIFDPSTAGVGTHTIMYSIVNQNSCSATTSKNVTVYDLPVATFVGFPSPAIRCVNADSIKLTPLDPSGTFTGTGVSGNYFYPSVAGIGVFTVTYTATNQLGCSSNSQQVIEVVGVPDANFTGLSTVYCSADNITVPLTPNFSGGTFSGPGIDPNANTWSPNNANLGQNTVTYEVSFAGCTSTYSKVVNVLLSPNADFVNLDDVYCSNDLPVNLTPINPGGTFTATSGVVSNKFYPQIATVGLNVISYTISSGNGCANTTSDTLMVANAPNAGMLHEINDVTLMTNVTGPGITYQWIDCENDSPIVGETSQEYTPHANGKYGVIIYNSEGCSDTSDCAFWHVTGLEETNLDENLSLYPNPNNGKFSIETPSDVKVDIVNSIGQVVYQGEFTKGIGVIDLSDSIETGMYIVRFTDEKGNSAYRNVVIRN